MINWRILCRAVGNKLLKRLMANTTGETEEKLMKLTIERICSDMCEHYAKFYTFEGPGVMVFKPGAEEKEQYVLSQC